MVRPSKNFLYGLLAKNLASLNSGVGLDASAANLKNLRMFKTPLYVGLDLDVELLRQGLAKNQSGRVAGLWADLADLSKLNSDSVDAVVSTNTLYKLAEPDRVPAIRHLCRLTSPEGMFFCQLPFDGQFRQSRLIISEYFQQITIYYYRNFFCRWYERLFEQEGFLGDHALAGSRPFRLLSWLISRLEFVTRFWPLGNDQVVLIGRDKKIKNKKQAFNLTDLPQIAPRLFSHLDRSR